MFGKNVGVALLVAFVLIGVLIVFNIFSYTGFVAVSGDKWACSQYVCDKAITAQEWVDKNCYALPDDSKQVVCKVVIDDKEQLVPLSTINTQTLNQCIEARCVQEVKVRSVDYKVDLQKLKEPQK